MKLVAERLPTNPAELFVNYPHMHGLLAVEQLIPHHPMCYQFYERVIQRLTDGRLFRTSTIGNTIKPLGKDEVVSIMAAFQLGRSFLCFLQKTSFSVVRAYVVGHSDDQVVQAPAYDLCSTVAMATHLLCSNVPVDTTEVFKAAAYFITSLPALCEGKCPLITEVCNLLLAMARYQDSPSVMKHLVYAVELMVKTSARASGKRVAFLQLLSIALRREEDFFPPFGGQGSSCVELGLLSNVKLLLAEFLCARANLNAVDELHRTGAHCVLMELQDIYCAWRYKRSPEDEALALLDLFNDFGIHWDGFYGNKRSLFEILERTRGMWSIAERLRRRVESLQCMAARRASQLDYTALPKVIQQFIEIHKRPPPTALPDAEVSVPVFNINVLVERFPRIRPIPFGSRCVGIRCDSDDDTTSVDDIIFGDVAPAAIMFSEDDFCRHESPVLWLYSGD